jgi:hypothetical protein
MTQNDDVVTLHGSVALQAVSEGIERWIINRIRRIIFISVLCIWLVTAQEPSPYSHVANAIGGAHMNSRLTDLAVR